MSENEMKKIKVYKKKVEFSPETPGKEAPGTDDEEFTSSSYEQEVAEDDEFERLLNQFINSELDDIETGIEEKPAPVAAKPTSTPAHNTGPIMGAGEKALLDAYNNFSNSIAMMAGMHDLPIPPFKVKAETLSPHYRSRIGNIIATDTIKGWDIMLQVHNEALSGLQPDAGDEELLDFAERATDEILQLAIISYVEILIELEGCEISLEERRLRSKRRKIEREIYEEHQQRIERKRRYIDAIESKKFPIDADQLINNYFKTAQKDPDGAYKVLINNPAVYAPIKTSKIKPRFFGLIKPTPQEGIRVNREIGNFLKKVKA